MKIKAFTLIEIIIVISIISLTTTIGAMTFFDFLKGREIIQITNEIQNNIISEDNKVTKNEIFDYKIIFDTNSKEFYTLYENYFDTENKVEIDGNSLKIQDTINGNEIWQVNIFENGKLIQSEKNTNQTLSFTKNINSNYLIENSIIFENKKILLNNISIINFESNKKSYNQEEIKKRGDTNLKLTGISVNENGNNLGKLEIVNICGKKEFYDSGSKIDENEIYLHFEKDGVKKYIIITK